MVSFGATQWDKKSSDMIEALRAIANKPAEQITDEDKQTIRKAAKAAGVKLPRVRACNSCWIDCAVLAFCALKSKENGQYRLRAGVDVLFNGERVNASTLTDARAERWLRAGLSRNYFVWS